MQVFVRRSSGELEAGWHTVGEARISRNVTPGEAVIRVRRHINSYTFVEKDVLVEALMLWQTEAAQGADVLPATDPVLLPTVDRIALFDGLDALLRGA